MDQGCFFKNARWVGKKDAALNSFWVLRGRFRAEKESTAALNLVGLGFFKCYINGVCINPDTFLPLSSDFEASCDPEGECLTAHRIYVSQFDITPYLRRGENVIAVHFGGGWYCFERRPFGLPKAIYCISVKTGEHTEDFVSDASCRLNRGLMEDYCFTCWEKQDYRNWEPCFSLEFEDSSWPYAQELSPLQTEYCVTDCPADSLVEMLSVKKISESSSGAVYDCGRNTTGTPVLRLTASAGERVRVLFSEELLSDGIPDPSHCHHQEFSVLSDGKERTVQAEFTWFGFRYFQVLGKAEPLGAKEIYTNLPVTATFESDNETLNWIYRTFLHTMHCNLHTGHPSDCPHIERRGYTGDGQLTCHAVFTVMEAKAFYEKWMRDIADGQDRISGHVQYTAPYIRSGGGPGGWGSAVVEVPYQIYRHYGDKKPLEDYYGAMRRYVDYLEEHSRLGLVISDKEGEWCLGDWCGPNILYPDRDVTSHNQQVFLPAAMVNTYFMVKSLEKLCEIAAVIGKEADIPEYEEKIRLRKSAIEGAFYNTFDYNFIMNVQGANAYGVDLGLGTEKTYENMVRYYEKVGCYDTGIFATDILTRLLFEHGDGELAFDLLTQSGNQGYEHWRQSGATTFHEYWDSNRSRSHCHPMFGAPVAYLFEYLLGIRQEKGSVAYASLHISPQALSRWERLKGSIQTPKGTVAVAYRRNGEILSAVVEIPKGVSARFSAGKEELSLREGKNEFEISCFSSES